MAWSTKIYRPRIEDLWRLEWLEAATKAVLIDFGAEDQGVLARRNRPVPERFVPAPYDTRLLSELVSRR